jgi:hypothetical protein
MVSPEGVNHQDESADNSIDIHTGMDMFFKLIQIVT